MPTDTKQADCRFHDECGLPAEYGDYCILHSDDPKKDSQRFQSTLEQLLKGDKPELFMADFPDGLTLDGFEFEHAVIFSGSTFHGPVYIKNCLFEDGCRFDMCNFEAEVTFSEVNGSLEINRSDCGKNLHVSKGQLTAVEITHTDVSGDFQLLKVVVVDKACFDELQVTGDVRLYKCQFDNLSFRFANLAGATRIYDCTFKSSISFDGTRFLGDARLTPLFIKPGDNQFISFLECHFSQPLELASNDPDQPLFENVTLIFRQVDLQKPDQVLFRHVDLTHAFFERSPIREVRFLDVRWPQLNSILTVYDQLIPRRDEVVWGSDGGVWHVLSDLKLNYAAKGDYQKSGDFHYVAMNMRRRSRDTPRSERFFLSLYWLTSGYGERYVRPLLWVGGLILLCTVLYASFGLSPKETGQETVAGWPNYLHFSIQATFLRSSEDVVARGLAGAVQTFQNVASPVLLGLFALAVRQRLKR